MNTSTNQILDPKNVLDQKETNRQVLQLLIDEQLSRNDTLFVQTAKMADTESYVASMSFQQVSSQLRFAKDLGLFKTMFDPETGEMKIDHDTIDEIQQRPLDYTRQLPLTIYLAGRRHHKFPSILAVLTDDWVDNPESPEWERAADGELRATSDSTRFTAIDSHGRVGVLQTNGYIYALDGQHRLLGIKGLMELIRDRRIVQKTKAGVPVKKDGALSIETLAESFNVNERKLNALENETIAVEIIPAVKQGETREEARRRVKSVFTHVNKSAVRLSPGQIAQLDEDDGFALVAKRVAVKHPLLKSTGTRKDHPRVNWQNSTISNTSTVLTTLQSLKEAAGGYLHNAYPHWVSPLKDLIPVRPDDDELEEGYEKFAGFLSGLEQFPSIRELDQGKTARDQRLPRRDGGAAHLLFRPVGQIALARAFGTLVFDQQKDQDELFRMLREYEAAGGLTIDDPSNPWWGVVYDPVGQKIARGGEDGAERLFLWLLGGMTDDQAKEGLRQLLVERRTIADGGPDEGKVRDFNGQAVPPENFRLPPMLT